MMNLDMAFCAPGAAHWLGCDPYGQDLALLIARGLGRSITVATAVVALKLLIALPAGTLLAWAPPLPRAICLRALDAILAFPGILLAILFAALLEPGLRSLIITLAILAGRTTRLVQASCDRISVALRGSSPHQAPALRMHWKRFTPPPGTDGGLPVHALASAGMAEVALCF